MKVSIRKCVLAVALLLSCGTSFAALVGQWDFDNASDLSAATVGSDLVLSGTDAAVPGYGGTDGAANIGIGSYYTCTHGILANGGGTNVNEWTLVMDIKLPLSSFGGWTSLYQTDAENTTDSDSGHDLEGAIGVWDTGYSDWDPPVFYAQPNKWYRFVFVVDNGTLYDFYVDGEKKMVGSVQSVDGRFSLDPDLLFFADNDGDDRPLEVSTILLHDQVLSAAEVAALAGPGGMEPSNVLTPPYLQSARTDSISIMWELAVADTCTLEYGLDSSYGSSGGITSADSVGGTKIYKSALSGLAAGTTYHYRVNAGSETGDDRIFTTAPAGDEDFSFVVWSDSQGSSGATTPMMLHMAASGADFGVACGDMAEDGGNIDSIRPYFLDRVATHLGSTMPFEIAWGNHDYLSGANDIKDFTDFGAGHYSFDHAECHFVCMDYEFYDSNYATWLDADLAAASGARRIFVFIHYPPYSELYYDGAPAIRNDIVPVLEQYDVDACFSGHVHSYLRGRTNGVHYCLTGGGSWLDSAEVLVHDWPHMTVGGYHDMGPGISGGLVNEYLKIDVTSDGWTAKVNAFGTDGTFLPDVSDTFGVNTAADATAPTPDPVAFAEVPHATGGTSIKMAAAPASDVSGVEYYFTCTAGGGHDSGWQDHAVYEDTGLTSSTQYSYTVMARDKSIGQNATAPSAAAAATTSQASASLLFDDFEVDANNEYVLDAHDVGKTDWDGYRYSAGLQYHPYFAPEDYSGFAAHSGTNMLRMYWGFIAQSLSETYVEGYTYTLSWWAKEYAASGYNYMEAYLTDTVDGMAYADNDGDGYYSDFLGGLAGVSIADADVTPIWKKFTLEYTATAADTGKPIGICLWGADDNQLDDVELSAVAPDGDTGIISFNMVSGNVAEMVFESPSPSLYRPLKRTDLVFDSWGVVMHSTNAVGGFVETNLSYSAPVSGNTNKIYLQANDPAAFFGIGER